MRSRTRQNTINFLLGSTPYELLGPNPQRKSIMLAPLASGCDSEPPVVAVVFNASGDDQTWTVPAGVTQLYDAFVWGSSGAAGAAGAVLGGGGGGGGGFVSLGALTVVPGTVYTILVDLADNEAASTINDPGGALIASAGSGKNGADDIGGAGGVAATGTFKENGGDGANATLLAGAGAGGGGAGGTYSTGGAGVGSAGGAGGGATSILTYGEGGNGGDGGGAGIGTQGTAPAGGGGGSGANVGAAADGLDGLVVLFYTIPTDCQGVSMSVRNDVSPGKGVFNWLPGQSFPIIITDDEIGNAVGLPWWFVSGVENVAIQVTEFSYEEPCGDE